MEAGDMGEKMLQEPVKMSADQFSIFLRQQRIAVRGRWLRPSGGGPFQTVGSGILS
jgi:hypothetical protein